VKPSFKKTYKSETAPSSLLCIVDSRSKSSDAPSLAHSPDVEKVSKNNNGKFKNKIVNNLISFQKVFEKRALT
jgi:hypothetical protein